jgi:HEAT repeat protein
MLAAGSRNKKAVEALSRAARSDDYALVREAAVRALARVDPAAARPVLSAVAQKDAEPRVQRTARKLLDNLKH